MLWLVQLVVFDQLLVVWGQATQSGDSLAAALLTRPPVLNLNFSTQPAGTTGWPWAASDPSDGSSAAALHQGVALLNGNSSSYIDLSTATGPQSAGGVLGTFGGAGYDGSGWSIEMVMKFPTVVQNLGSCLFLFQDAANSYMTMVWGNAYDSGDADVGNRLEAHNVNAASTGVPVAATAGAIEFFTPNNQTWYHMVWTLAPSPNQASGTALWSLYINGQLQSWASQLVSSPAATLTPIQGANYPQASNRTIALLGKDSGTNMFTVTVDPRAAEEEDDDDKEEGRRGRRRGRRRRR